MTPSATQEFGPFVTGRFGDRYLQELNPSSFNQADAATIYRQRFGGLLKNEEALHVIIGSDSGLLPAFIHDNNPAPGSRYLFVELEQVEHFLQTEGCCQNLPENIDICTAEQFQDQASRFQLTDYIYLDAVQIWEALTVADAKLVGYRDLAAQIRQSLNATAYDVIMRLGSQNYIDKQIANLSENRVAGGLLETFTETFKDKTAIILGGGPSLDEFLPWVKENSNKVAIFAVSRISKRLLEYGLTPHFVVSIDASECNVNISREMFLFPEGPILVNANHVDPQLLSSWAGPSIYLAPRFPWHTPLNDGALLPWGPTVTNTALGVAVEMGFSQAILIGVDLCYSCEGLTHASGSDEYKAGPKLDTDITVTTNAGNTSETSSDYFSAIGYLAEQAVTAKQRGCQIVSPAPNAARIEHVSYLPIDKLTIDSLTEAPNRSVQAIMPTETNLSREKDCQLVLKELSDVRKQLKRISTLSDKAISYTEKLLTPGKKQAIPHFKDKISKIDLALIYDFPNVVPLVKQYGIRSFLKLKTVNQKETKSAQKAQENLRQHYKAYSDTATILISIIESAIRRTESRLTEEISMPQPKPMPPNLFNQYYSDKTLFRILVFKHRHPEHYCFTRDWCKEWEKNVRCWLEERLQNKSDPRKPYSLDGVLHKAANLYMQQNNKALERLAAGLSRHPDKKTAGDLASLVNGYLFELAQDWDQALDAYQLLIGDEMTPLAEAALQRVSVICLKQNNLEMAALALDCLSHTSAAYQLQYADLLCELGRRQEAADLYTAYLEQVPTDMEAMLKLGTNYREMGEEAVAQQVFRLILQQQPENKAAQSLLNNGSQG